MGSYSAISVSAEIEHWRELAAQLRFPVYTEASPALAKSIAEHNEKVGATSKSIDDAFSGLQAIIAQAESPNPGNPGDLISAVEKCRLDRGIGLQAMTELWQSREQLAKRAQEEFAKLLPPAETALKDAREKAHKDLASVGCCREAVLKVQPTLLIAPEQWDFIVDNRVGPVLAARGAVQNARALIDAASEQLTHSIAGREATRMFVARRVRALAAV